MKNVDDSISFLRKGKRIQVPLIIYCFQSNRLSSLFAYAMLRNLIFLLTSVNQILVGNIHVTDCFQIHGMTAENENDKLLLAARKIRKATSTDFIVSLVADDFSRASSTYVGKLR